MAGRKFLLIGVDGAVPSLIKLFSREGLLPNITGLIEDGVFAEAYPCVPCDTPTNWTTLATGSTTVTHGVTSFCLHVPGEPLDLGVGMRSRSSLSNYCLAEYFWDSAEKNGLTSFVLNYPVGWPATFKNGYMSLFSWPTRESLPWMLAFEKTYSSFETSAAEDEALPSGVDSFSSPLETRMVIMDGGNEFLRVSLLDSEGGGYDSILVFEDDGGERYQFLGKGGWSDWISVPLETEYGVLNGLFKLKLEGVSPDGRGLEVFRSKIYNVKDWTYPPDLAEKIVKEVLFEYDFEPFDFKRIPYDIYGVEREYVSFNMAEVKFLSRIVDWAKGSFGWDLCYLHYHLLDGVNHRFTCPFEGLPRRSSEEVEEAKQFYRLSYMIVDQFVGELLESVVDDDTVVVVVADHGVVPSYRTVNIARVLVDEGLLAYRWSSELDKYVVDWEETLAFPYHEPPYVWVNLKGREPHGIVDPEKFEEVRSRVIDCLLSIKDKGRRVVALALTREDAAVLGQGGGRVGDVVYLLNPPYQIWDDKDEVLDTGFMLPEVMDGDLIRDSVQSSGAHVYYLPTAKTGSFSVAAPLIISGPGVERGLELKKPVNMIDVVPTAAKLLNIPPPKDNEGRVLTEILG